MNELGRSTWFVQSLGRNAAGAATTDVDAVDAVCVDREDELHPRVMKTEAVAHSAIFRIARA